jgi:RNA polymerase sigma factor (TIGR02999 family)
MAGAQHQVTPALEDLGNGAAHAAVELLPLVYTELRRLAASKMAKESPGHTLQATALVHEAYLRLAGGDNPQQWHNRTHFFGAAAEAMRRILIENARRKMRAKRGGRWERVEFHNVEIAAPTPEDKLLQINAFVDELASENPVEAQVVKLHYFVGLSLVEMADALCLSVATVRRRLAFAKIWLMQRIQSHEKGG